MSETNEEVNTTETAPEAANAAAVSGSEKSPGGTGWRRQGRALWKEPV